MLAGRIAFGRHSFAGKLAFAGKNWMARPGHANNPKETIGEVTTDEFVRVMITNALSPLRVIESLEQSVTATGLIGVMSSGQGSIADNETGMREVYRGSKAALNMFMHSYAARRSGTSRAMVLMALGWVAPTWAVRTAA